MNPDTEKPSPLRRVWTTIVTEFTPPPKPRPTPSEKEFAAGHLAVGTITDAIEDGPGGDVQGADMLIVSAEIPGHETIHRREICPLSTPGGGHRLIGQPIKFRHTTYDADYERDILVTWWPPGARETVESRRYEGPGALRARIWNFLSGVGVVIGCAGIMLAPLLLCNLVVGSLTGAYMLADFLSAVHPATALAVSAGLIPMGLFFAAVGATRRDALLSRQKKGPGQNPR